MRKIKNFVLLIMALIVIILFILQSNYFIINEIKINGNVYLTTNDIITPLQKMKDDNIIYMNTKKLKSKIVEDIRVKEVDIKRVYPDKIEINILERNPVGIIYIDDEVLIVDNDLNIFAYENEITDKKMPIITFNEENKEKISNVLKILENTQLYDLVSEIYEDNENKIMFALDSGVKIIVNEEISENKIENAMKILKKEKDSNLEYVDLRFSLINIK